MLSCGTKNSNADMALPDIVRRFRKALLPYIVLVSFAGFSQQQDTLRNLVAAKGYVKLARLEHWCNQVLFFRKPLPKIKMLNELEQIALKENDRITLASITFYRGLYVMSMDGQQHEKGIAKMNRAIAMAEKNGQPLQAAYFKHSLGYYHFTRRKNPAEALQNMLQAHYVFEKAGYHNIYDQAGMLDRLSYVYYHLNNYHESIKYLRLSLKNPIGNQRRHISLLNTIGQSYRELFEPDSARKYFRKSHELAIQAKDTAWIGITSGNIGWLYLSEKQYARARPYMEKYYKCGLVAKDSALQVEALTGLADIALNQGQVDLALQQLRQAEFLFGEAFKKETMSVESYVRKQYLYNVLAKAWDKRGDAVRSLGYLKQANIIKDSIERRSKLSKNIAIQQMFEAEQTNNRLKLLNEEKETAEMKQQLYIVIGLSLALIIVLLYRRQVRERKIRKQKETLLKLEKEKAEIELQSSRERLEEYVQNLRQKAELVEKIQSEMDLMREQHPVQAEDEKAVLNKLNFATILTEDDWQRFKTLFDKVHVGFFIKLKTAYPGLTPAETRLCSLLRLGINSNEMAAMMGISAVSIKKNRQRLRKKINLSKEEKLEDLFVDF